MDLPKIELNNIYLLKRGRSIKFYAVLVTRIEVCKRQSTAKTSATSTSSSFPDASPQVTTTTATTISSSSSSSTANIPTSAKITFRYLHLNINEKDSTVTLVYPSNGVDVVKYKHLNRTKVANGDNVFEYVDQEKTK
ncbi:PH domain-containing protein [Tieghemostelium lacteum]|uniref:PH domain-containing protein n=1 Tax=Tieghemostelium lacteum TaxID=361077 RepID=A0A152A188_TIELA|nr:PH domain-containing protein [Tieghemostelium lacteum]|eukprot:KYR00008.1 PH domain-containing protein [Tieghemostelium lacteum]